MKTLDQWFAEYSSSHQNPLNIRIHKICVPAIFWSIVALAGNLTGPWGIPVLSVLIVLVVPFYFRLGLKALALFVAYLLASFFLTIWIQDLISIVPFAIGVFVLAWIGQFYGHKIEGKKPSFLQDLQFLLVGPLWVIWGHKSKSS